MSGDQRMHEGLMNCAYIVVPRIRVGERVKATFPIYADASLQTGTATFNPYMGMKDSKPVFSITTRKAAQAQCVFTNPVFSFENNSFAERNKKITFQITVKNTGDKAAENVRVAVSSTEKVQFSSDKLMQLTTLKAGESRTVSFDFKTMLGFSDDRIVVSTVANASNISDGAYMEFSTPVKTVEVVTAVPQAKDYLTLTWIVPYTNELVNNVLTDCARRRDMRSPFCTGWRWRPNAAKHCRNCGPATSSSRASSGSRR